MFLAPLPIPMRGAVRREGNARFGSAVTPALSRFIDRSRQRSLFMLALLGLSIVFGFSAPAHASDIFSINGLAIRGYDPVAYFTWHRAVPGKSGFSLRYRGAEFRFATAEHRDAFKADPARYAPQYGGYCAFGVAKGQKAPIDPKAFTIVGEKLYLNYSDAVMQTWRQDVPAYVAKGDRNWPRVSRQAEP